MILSQLTKQIKGTLISGDAQIEVSQVTSDSRKITQDAIYVAIKGTDFDGNDFIPQAVEAGAAVIVSESGPTQNWKNATWVQVPNARAALAFFATELAEHPSRKLKLVGVTGTNGKTTTSYMIHYLMQSRWHRAGLVGSVKVFDGVEEIEANYTTPDAVELQRCFSLMVDNDCRGAAIEVSSHGIEQKRIQGTDFNTLVFTNLSQDHLDYHGTMDTYFEAKKQWFSDAAKEEKKACAVVNLDDPHGAKIAREFADSLKIITFGMGVHCDYRFGEIKQSVRGSEFELQVKGKSFLVRLPMIGRFNIYNAVAAIAASVSVGIKIRDAVQALASIPQVPGRVELVDTKMGVSVFVDYAHTPDALINVCSTLKELEPKRLLTVFGCGGDRDVSKRPLMAQAAASKSNYCFITSDNPRTEDPAKIIADIEKGISVGNYESIIDREQAIKTAVEASMNGDIILIAGKGHEDYQIFADETINFDDRIKAREALKEFKQPARNREEDFSRENYRRGDRPREDRPREDRPKNNEYKNRKPRD